MHRYLSTCLTAGLACWLLGVSTAGAQAAYVIGPKDLVSITVYEHDDLTQSIRIPPDGMITLPLIGETKASGITTDQLAEDLAVRFREYIINPQVQVAVEEYHTREVSILGEVKKPGLYKFTGNASLLEILSEAGGLTQESGDTISILRNNGGGKNETIEIDARRLFTLEGADLNVLVRDRDTIHVPRVEAATSVFYIMGEVKSPGSYRMDPSVKTNVLKAISMAGGFTDKASKRGIKVTREVGDQVMTFKVEMETEIRPQDTIIIQESFF